MKKILLAGFAAMLFGLSNTTNGQCTFGNPGVRIIGTPYTNPSGKCVVNMELSFDILHNPGGKYFWVHLWPTSVYPDYNYPQSQPPTTTNAGRLDLSIATFGFWHQGSVLVIQPEYPPDKATPDFQMGYSITEIQGGGILPGSDRYTLTGLTITLPQDCTVPQSLTADLWESQSAHAQTIACVSKNVVIYANDPKAAGNINCRLPRTFNFNINTIDPLGLVVSYKVYIDDGDSIYNQGLDSINVAGENNIPLDVAHNYRYAVDSVQYLPWSNQKPYADRDLWLVVTSPSRSNFVFARIDNICWALPVHFISFSAIRNQTLVWLKWTTGSEFNNSGFAVERNTDGTWQEIAFIPSLANGGNSDITLNYQYTDINTEKGISQYRLRQVNLDGQSKYSDIVAVRGENQPGKIIVYPNPSSGSVHVVFESADVTRDVLLTDMTGRVLSQWRSLTANNLRIDNLNSGLYMLKVMTIESGRQQVEKIVVTR